MVKEEHTMAGDVHRSRWPAVGRMADTRAAGSEGGQLRLGQARANMERKRPPLGPASSQLGPLGYPECPQSPVVSTSKTNPKSAFLPPPLLPLLFMPPLLLVRTTVKASMPLPLPLLPLAPHPQAFCDSAVRRLFYITYVRSCSKPVASHCA